MPGCWPSLASHSPRAAKIMARRVSRRTLMAVARADAAAADHATGRWVATANATVARITGLCERTVQYARATPDETRRERPPGSRGVSMTVADPSASPHLALAFARVYSYV